MTTTKIAQVRTARELPGSVVTSAVGASVRLNLMAKAPLGEGERSSFSALKPHGSPAAKLDRGPFVVVAPPSPGKTAGAADVTTTSEKVRHDQANDHQRERVRRDPCRDS